MRKCKGCLKVGQYCGMHIWVLPGGQDELTKLTLNILNYAYNDPTPGRTKSVVWELDSSGAGGGDCDDTKCPCGKKLPASTTPDQTQHTVQQANPTPRKITVTATLPFDEPVVPYCGNNTCRDRAIYNVFERPDLHYGPSQPSAIPGAGYLQFQQNFQNLAPQTSP